MKFNVSVLVEASDGINPSEHAVEQSFRPDLVSYSSFKGYLRNPDDFDLISNSEFVFAHG